MHSTPDSAANTPPAFELKGRMLTLSVLRLLTTDLDALTAQLDERMSAMPGLFKHLPVVLELDAVEGRALELEGLAQRLRQKGLIPIGVRAGDDTGLVERAAAAGLGALNLGNEPARRAEPVRERPAAPPVQSAGMVVKQPVRSGQQIYARGGDLVILAPVSAGAEVLADGHIHVYGALRGRALAGVQGNNDARIFCQSLEAELVSVAGSYRVSENIQATERGRPVQIYLDGETLCIKPL